MTNTATSTSSLVEMDKHRKHKNLAAKKKKVKDADGEEKPTAS